VIGRYKSGTRNGKEWKVEPQKEGDEKEEERNGKERRKN